VTLPLKRDGRSRVMTQTTNPPGVGGLHQVDAAELHVGSRKPRAVDPVVD